MNTTKESPLGTNKETTGKIDTKVLLSTLWIVVMINMLKADILSLYIPGAEKNWREPQPALAHRFPN